MGKNRKRRTKAEAILHKARTEPSATCHDPRQISLFDYDKARAFAKLDAAIQTYGDGLIKAYEGPQAPGGAVMSGRQPASTPISIPSTMAAIPWGGDFNMQTLRE